MSEEGRRWLTVSVFATARRVLQLSQVELLTAAVQRARVQLREAVQLARVALLMELEQLARVRAGMRPWAAELERQGSVLPARVRAGMRPWAAELER